MGHMPYPQPGAGLASGFDSTSCAVGSKEDKTDRRRRTGIEPARDQNRVIAVRGETQVINLGLSLSACARIGETRNAESRREIPILSRSEDGEGHLVHASAYRSLGKSD